jgi:DNA repair photolyase
LERDESWDPAQDPAPRTQFLKDRSESIIARNDSPDVPFSASLNPYRGCEHGCIYCYARPTHEYLGFSVGLDFETRIMVKERAPDLLRRELSSRKWSPQVIALSGVTDPYQPVERRLELTRGCLSVLSEYRNPVSVVTKNRLVTRDFDLLGRLAGQHQAASLMVSLSTLDTDLAHRLEPRTTVPRSRLEIIRAAVAAGIPTGVIVAPVIPGLTDHEIPTILKEAARAGAQFAGYVALRLPHGVGDLFVDWLDRHFPERKVKILNRVQAIHGGQLCDYEFGARMLGQGKAAEQMKQLFEVSRRKEGLDAEGPELSTASFRAPQPDSGSRQQQLPF